MLERWAKLAKGILTDDGATLWCADAEMVGTIPRPSKVC